MSRIVDPLFGLREAPEGYEDHGFAVGVETEDIISLGEDSVLATVNRLLSRNYEQACVDHPEWGLTGKWDLLESYYDFGLLKAFAWYERVKKETANA